MEEKFENICEECGTPFESTDEEATLCSSCWEKIVGMEGEGLGEN